VSEVPSPRRLGAVRSSFAPWDDPRARPLVRFEGVTKRFGGHAAVDDVTLSIYEGEFFALLGPSGCGKSTLMRLLAGFETPDAGRVLLAGQDLAGSPPHRRPVNMMFQSYALFPHLTVAQNIEFGLRQEAMGKAERQARVAEMLELVKLQPFAGRRPAQLSGGQRQRVALARAIAKKPRTLLLDEPLGALDKKLREETQFELKALQAELGMTFLIVTHDQEEAMTMADRRAVMNEGRIVQVDRPEVMYEAPSCRFVAGFLGDVNLIEARVEALAPPMARLSALETPGGLTVLDADSPPAGSKVTVAVRPEKLAVTREAAAAGALNTLAGQVVDIGYTGDWTTYVIELAGGRRIRAAQANAARFVDRPITWGDAVTARFAPEAGVVLTS
jgi:putrescine transport system ATP-binding protein